MPDLPISGLPSLTTPLTTDVFPIVDGSITYQTTVLAAGKTILNAGLPITASGVSSSRGFTGSLQGTATSASYALTASYSRTSTSASYAISASYAPSNAFPYTGNAQITGSLSVTGGITGSLLATGNIIPSVSKSFSLGSTDFPFKDIYISSGSLIIASDNLGALSTTLSNVSGNILISAGGMQLLGSGSFNASTGSFQYLSGSLNYVGRMNTSGSQTITGSLDVTGSGTLNGRAIATSFTASFDPLFNDVSGSVVGTTSTGSYTLIDGLCYFRVFVDFTNCTNFGNSQYKITLPFPSIQTISQRNGSIHQAGSGSALYHIAGITESTESAVLMKLYYSGGTTDLPWKYNTPVGATSPTSQFDISGIYQIAQ